MALLPDDISADDALMLVDMVATGFTGVELGNIRFGDTVCVIGIGPVGLMAIKGTELRGAGRIFAVGTRPNCVAIAREFGATDIISYRDGDIATQILERTNGYGTDVTIIAGGDNDTFTQAIMMTRCGGGNIVNLNYLVGDKPLEIPMQVLMNGLAGKNFRGDLCSGGRVCMERFISLVRHGRIQPGKLVSHRFYGLDKMEDALYLMRDKPRDLIKPVVYLEEAK